MKERIKTVIIIFLCITNFVSWSITLILLNGEGSYRIPPVPEDRYIIVGYPSNIYAIDPLDTWYVTYQVPEHQVVEGLVDYNYSDHPNYVLIPKLATKWHYHSASEISFKLREGVWFHDGEKWDATAAIWNFERLVYFCNYTGNLVANETSWEAFPASLYFFSNGTPIFSHFVKNSEYNFTIFLNGPFAPVLDLLAFSGTYMLSPKSTPCYKFLDVIKDKLIGTGPFKYVRFKPDVDVRFDINPHYWGKSPWTDKLIFRIVRDDTARMVAGLAGQFDYVGGVPKSYIPVYNNSHEFPGFTIADVGEDLCYFYLEFYCGPPYNSSAGQLEPNIKEGKVNQKLNSTWRRALALTINYTQIWSEITGGSGFPGCPTVSRSMPSFNSSLDGKMAHDFPIDGTYAGNIKKARELMQSMGYGIGWDPNYNGTNETEWLSADFWSFDIRYYPYPHDWLHYIYTIYPPELRELIESNFNLIGVNFDVNYYLGDGSDNICGLWAYGWCSDYLDAYNILGPLFNNESGACHSLISDPILKNALETAAATTNTIARQNIYKWIQSYIFDITRPENPSSYCHVPLWVYRVHQVHKNDLNGIGYNVMGMLDCWNWYIE